jgi:hypothetical protein
MLVSDIIDKKGLYRFTGPPENWLTAIKFMTWGLNKKNENKWKEIQPGDLFILHSTKSNRFSNSKPSFIGFSIVGSNFSIKDNLLWIEEQESKKNIWPYLVPFSEIYLYSELPNPSTWESPNLISNEQIPRLIGELLKKAIPFNMIDAFPAMGSMSTVTEKVALNIINFNLPFYLFTNHQADSVANTIKSSEFISINSSKETYRYAETLSLVEEITPRILRSISSVFEKDNDLLDKAEKKHSEILDKLINRFREKGFDTFCNRFVDLIAFNGRTSCLIEVKTTENNNFRPQARKGVIQLLEYDYFEVNKFLSSFQNSSSINKLNYLITSQNAGDNNYVGFINQLEVGVGFFSNSNSFSNNGEEFGLTNILNNSL